MRRRAASIAVTALACALSCASCATRSDPITTAQRRAAAFLAGCQLASGKVHSDRYGLLRPGYSLTAIALCAWSLCPSEIRRDHADAVERAFAYLRSATRDDGSIGTGEDVTDYPCYISAFYLLALANLRPKGWRELAARQVRYLESIQVHEAGGWKESDVAFGGFGFGGLAPRKPNGGDDVNISTTSWALAALHAAGAPRATVDACTRRAAVFVARCQRRDPGPSRGGFYFTTTPEGERSKLGDRRPYRSASLDGLRALRLAQPSAEPWLRAAEAWLGRARPMIEDPDAQRRLDAMRFYEAAAYRSAARTLPPSTRLRLLAQQAPDGSWRNDVDLMKEDDPVVATALALIALSRR